MAMSHIVHLSVALIAAAAVLMTAVLQVDTTIKKESESSPDGIRWELLDVLANQLSEMPEFGLSHGDHYLSPLWAKYLRSSRSEKPQAVEELKEAVKHMVNLDMTFEMIEVLLFGPPLGPVRDPGTDLALNWECLKPTVDLFEKNCPVMTQYTSRHLSSFQSICSHLVDRDVVEEAFKVACGKTESDDGIRWELLDVMANQFSERLAKMSEFGVSQKHHDLLFLWSIYHMSTRSQKSQTVEAIRKDLKGKAELNMTLSVIEVLLFGPPDISLVREKPEQTNDDCLEYNLYLFQKHCGPVLQHGSYYTKTYEKICDKLVDRAVLEEAFKVACSNNTLE